MLSPVVLLLVLLWLALRARSRRVEAELNDLAIRVVELDFPFLGACYGIGVLGTLDGGTVDRTYGEPIGALPVRLSAEGAEDPDLPGSDEPADPGTDDESGTAG